MAVTADRAKGGRDGTVREGDQDAVRPTALEGITRLAIAAWAPDQESLRLRERDRVTVFTGTERGPWITSWPMSSGIFSRDPASAAVCNSFACAVPLLFSTDPTRPFASAVFSSG